MPDDPIQDVLDLGRERMDEALKYLRSELATIRAGRASPSMLQNIKVEYYGSQTPLNQIASVNAPQPDLLLIQPFDRNAISNIERAIMESNMGLNPSNDGAQIRVPIPPLSEERRKELVKTVRERAEEAKISLRNIRRDVKDDIKKTTERENLSEDVRYGAEEELQEITDAHVARVDELVGQKEKEIMTV
jgi:ribosome recycling factor